MNQVKPVKLPGAEKQLQLLFNTYPVEGKSVLIPGVGSPDLLQVFVDMSPSKLEVLLFDDEQIMVARMHAPKSPSLRIKFMDYTVTDYADNTFDCIYAPGTLSILHHSRMLAEMRRILKPGGVFCLGELAYTKDDIPISVNTMWQDAGLYLQPAEKLLPAYTAGGFELISQADFTDTLKGVYQDFKVQEDKMHKLAELQLPSTQKKQLTRYKHEANMYLKMGAAKYTGYFVYLLRKTID